MLGQKIGQERGKIIGTRFVQGEGGKFVKMEVTFQAEATLAGQQGVDMGTYTICERIPGQLYGEGQGIFMTRDGGGVIWNGFGVGSMTGKGMGVKWAAAITYQTNVDSLKKLNGIVGAVEHETDADNNATSTTWEWKC